MAVYRKDIIPETENRIYERKGFSILNREYVYRYLNSFEDSSLVYDGKVICDTGFGIRYIYFRDDFPDDESLARLYNFILNGDGSREYYLYHLYTAAKNTGMEVPLDEETVKSVADLKETYEKYDEQVSAKSFVVESEYDDDRDLRMTEVGIRKADHYRHRIIINTGETSFSLARKANELYQRQIGPQTSAITSATGEIRKPTKKEEYEFLYDRDREKFFDRLADILPFSKQLRKNLEEKKETFADCLFRLMREKGIESQSQLTAKNGRLGVSKAVMSKWINNKDPNRTPDKATVYAIIMAARLDMKDAEALLKSANLSFGYDMEDIIVKTFIDNSMYDLEKLNDVVFEVTHKTLLNKRDG